MFSLPWRTIPSSVFFAQWTHFSLRPNFKCHYLFHISFLPWAKCNPLSWCCLILETVSPLKGRTLTLSIFMSWAPSMASHNRSCSVRLMDSKNKDSKSLRHNLENNYHGRLQKCKSVMAVQATSIWRQSRRLVENSGKRWPWGWDLRQGMGRASWKRRFVQG